MRNHAHKKRNEKAGFDVEEGDLRDESDITSNIGGGTNLEGVELIDHHHHRREIKVRQMLEGSSYAWIVGRGKEGKGMRTEERYLALLYDTRVCSSDDKDRRESQHPFRDGCPGR